jgi:hypothetical protein
MSTIPTNGDNDDDNKVNNDSTSASTKEAVVVAAVATATATAATATAKPSKVTKKPVPPKPVVVPNEKEQEKENKFDMVQRIDSIKSFIIGAIAGSIGMIPVAGFHNLIMLPNDEIMSSVITNPYGQLEYDLDTAAFEAGLFTIVYRYCIRTDTNEQLNQGVVSAFVVVRTLSRIVIPNYCTALPIYCGTPFGYFDWYLLQQLTINGIESIVLFGTAQLAINYAISQKFVSKFP